MNRYEVIIYWSEDDGRYIAEVPELPGCMADGETRMEVLNNVETIISEWLETANLEGREIPVPKGKLAYGWQC
jgi:predicted RNase H-like HicB family nuclease